MELVVKQINKQYRQNMYQQRKQPEFVDQISKQQSSQQFTLNLSIDHKQKLQFNKQSGLLNEDQLRKLTNFLQQSNNQLQNKKEQKFFIPQTKSSQQRKNISQTHFDKINQQWDKQDIAKHLLAMPFDKKLNIVELMFGSDLIQKKYSQPHFMYSSFLQYLKKQKFLTLKIRMTDLPQIKSINTNKNNNKVQGINNYFIKSFENQDNKRNGIFSITQSHKNPQFDTKISRQMYRRISIIMQQLQRKHNQNLLDGADQHINLTNLSRNSKKQVMTQYYTMLRMNKLKQIKGSEKNQRGERLSNRIKKIRQLFGNDGDEVVQDFNVKIKKMITKAYNDQQLQKTRINLSIILTDKVQQQHKKRKMNEKVHIIRRYINSIQNIQENLQIDRAWLLVVILLLTILIRLSFPLKVIRQVNQVNQYYIFYEQNLGYSPARSSLIAFLEAALCYQ